MITKLPKKILILVLPIVLFSCSKNKLYRQGDAIGISQLDSMDQSLDQDGEIDKLHYWDSLYNVVKTPKKKARVNFYRSTELLRRNQLDSAHIIAERLTDFYSKNHDYRHLLEAYAVLGNIHLVKNNTYLANYYFKSSADIICNFDDINIPNRLMILFRASELSREMKQYGLARKYIAKGKEIANNLSKEESRQYYTFYFKLIDAVALIEQPVPDLDSSLMVLKELKPLIKSTAIDSIEGYYNFYSAKSTYHYYTKEWDSCIFYQKKALEYNMSDTDVTATTINANLIGIFSRTKEFNEAEKIILAIKDSVKRFDTSTQLNFKENYLHYLIATGKTQEALQYFEGFMEEKDDFYSGENTRANTQLTSIYEIKRKEEDIRNLSDSLDSQNIVIRQNQIYLFVLIGFLALIFPFFVLYVNRQKRKELKFQNQSILQANTKLHLEQRLLRSQMNPHFIFNSLSALQSFIINDKKELSLKYLGLFSKLLRRNLEESTTNEIKLGQEIGSIENYLKLQQLRYTERFNFEIILSPEIDREKNNISIAPMLIQPFIENAVIHGVKNLPYTGLITVEISKVNDLLNVIIKDNGKGIIQKGRDDKHKSFAINLVRERLKILESITHKISNLEIIGKTQSGGVKVILDIPI